MRRPALLLIGFALLGVAVGWEARRAVAAPSTSAPTLRVAASTSAQQDEEQRERKRAKVRRGKRVSSGDLPFTGDDAPRWLILGLSTTAIGLGFVMTARGASPTGASGPLWNVLIRVASCGFPQDRDVFDLKPTEPRRDQSRPS
jgi:hypothetical protein